MKQKIALFGASGQTGQQFLKLALENDFEVKALVRNLKSISQNDTKLEIYQGDVLNSDDVSKVLKGADIVVSLFGHVKGSPEWLQTDGTKNIVEAMKQNKVKRIISLSGGGLPFPEKDEPKFADKLIRTIMKIVVPKILNDAIKHYEVLKSSGLVWTIVRGPRLTNDAKTRTYRVGWVGVNASTKISRADLAEFILSQVEDEKFNFQMPFISN
jgi:putative NADH-flavin reductase